MIYASLVVAVTCLVASSRASFVVISTGNCPEVPLQGNFELERYLGTWYSYEDFDVPYQFLASCITASYSLKSPGVIRVVNTGTRDFKWFGRTLWKTPVEAIGEARALDPSQPAGLTVQFGNQPLPSDGKPNYRIVSTDYTTYSLVYSCYKPTPLPLRIEAAWILTRQRGVRPANTESLKLVLRQYGIDTKNFKVADQEGCDI